MIMDEPDRGALKLVWCIAASLFVVGLVEVGLELVSHLMANPPTPVQIFPLVLKSVPAVLAIVVLIKSRVIAEWISNKMDE
jgi:uncharacterized protein (DUF983 family)